MNNRISLHNILKEASGVNHVYFQPPESVKIIYPCVIYQLSDEKVQHADNIKHIKHKRYMVTVIDKDPDSEIPDKIGALPLCGFDRFYTADNLNHWVYEIYHI